jgi:flagellar biosynthesis protein FliR
MSVSIPQVQYFVLAMTRVFAILATVPILGGAIIPSQVRIGLGFLFTMLLIPSVNLPASDAEAISIFAFTIATFQEFLIGFISGFSITATFAALQITGELIGMGAGFTSSRILNPAFDIAGSTLDQFFLMLTLLFMMATDSHHIILIAIQRTFAILPINSSISSLSYETAITTFVGLLNAGIQIALPAIGALLMADVTLGLLAKVAPQIQVFFLGVPLKIALGLLAVIITLSMFYPTILQLLGEMGTRIYKLLGA